MIIGHLPAGYMAAVGLTRFLPSRALFLGVVLGAVLPDIDMLWFVLVDSSYHHHALLPHRPIVWLGILITGLLWQRKFMTGLGLGGVLHVTLDTTLGQIAWAWPISARYWTFIEVQPTHSHYLLSFANHWTFQVELALVGLALLVFWKRRKASLEA
ncbi:MAG: metal-dependent hydrolase [Silicimonas sp.]|nr:metal-dependent hydrolase [Silicimonas sp.]